MKVGGQIHACGEDTSLILSFGLAVKLFPPLGYEVNGRLIVCKDFDLFSFS